MRFLLPKQVLCTLALLAMATPAFAQRTELLRYNSYSAGFKVGEMTIERGVSSNSLPYHRFAVRSRGAARLFNRVDCEMLCETFGSGDEAGTLFTRRYRDRSLEQNDTMRLWPGTGLVVQDLLDTGESITSRVDVGSHDVATFFCTLGATLEDGTLAETNSIVRKVVLDGRSHEVVLTLGGTNTLRTAFGRLPARDMEIVSHSDTLFFRNKPKRIKLSADYPVFLEMDIENRYGTQHFRLVEWLRDDRPFQPDP